MSRKIISADSFEVTTEEAIEKKELQNFDSKSFRIPQRFVALNRMIVRDLNENTSSPTFSLYSKDQIAKFIKDPYTNRVALRNASVYMYGASSHYRRLIWYFAGLSDLSYIVSPYRLDTEKADKKKISSNYHKVLDLLSGMNIKEQFAKVLLVSLREDTFYGTLREVGNTTALQKLPPDYCDIASIEGNVLNVSFNFSYFDSHRKYLEFYPDEFSQKYELYKSGAAKKWQDLSAPNSFAVKCNNDILDYPMPPFCGVFREVYDLEDYKNLKLTKTELENYAMLVMKLGLDHDGEFSMDYDRAKEFWRNLDNVLPEEIGSVLSPMEIEKISFERNKDGNSNTIADAEQQLYSAAGVSSLLFNNEKASSNALLLSVKADQAITFGIVKSIESVINRFMQSHNFGKGFKLTFLDCSPFNRKEIGDLYLKACQFGIPMVAHYCASQGLSQAEMESMNYLENDVLDLHSKFIPLQSSATMSSPGAPQKEAGDISDGGEKAKEGSGDN